MFLLIQTLLWRHLVAARISLNKLTDPSVTNGAEQDFWSVEDQLRMMYHHSWVSRLVLERF